MIVSLFIQITVFIWYVGLTALLLLLSYIWIKKLLLDPIQYLIETSPKNQKGNLMKPGHLDNHIFNLDAIVMIEPYDDGGLVHCTDNHAYRISEAEYQELRKLLGKEVLNREVKHSSSAISKPNHENGS